MRILILSPWFAPAYNAGGPVRSLVNWINTEWEGWDIYILTTDRDVDGQPLKSVQVDQWMSIGSNCRIMYLSRRGLWWSLRRQIRTLKPDALFISGIYSLLFSIWPLFCCRTALNIVSARGMLHPGALQKKKLKKWVFLFFYRPFVKWMNIVFHATDEKEVLYVRKALGDGIPVKLASNIPTWFSLPPLYKESGKLQIIIVALIGPMKNHLKIIQSLGFVNGEVDLHVVGPVYDRGYWEDCLKAATCLPPSVRFHYHGEVSPDKVADYLFLAHVFTCPSESENFGHAILEALSAGKPVIISHATPWMDLDVAKAGINVAVSEKELAGAIQFFIDMSNEEYRVWSDSAAVYARARIDMPKIKSQYISLFSKQ
jgi:glycosyltransferase involved in cell wall biosynthesis